MLLWPIKISAGTWHWYAKLSSLRNQEKGVLAKGVSTESRVTPKDTNNTRGHWAQQYIWHSQRHGQERRASLQKPPSKKALPAFFFCACFFPFLALSTPSFVQAIFFPKIYLSGTSDLLCLVEKRQPPGAGFWGQFWTRSPHRKRKENPFFPVGATKGEPFLGSG